MSIRQDSCSIRCSLPHDTVVNNLWMSLSRAEPSIAHPLVSRPPPSCTLLSADKTHYLLLLLGAYYLDFVEIFHDAAVSKIANLALTSHNIRCNTWNNIVRLQPLRVPADYQQWLCHASLRSTTFYSFSSLWWYPAASLSMSMPTSTPESNHAPAEP